MKQDIGRVDANFQISTEALPQGFHYYSADEVPLKIYGVFREGDRYRRLPEAIAKSVSQGVNHLHANTAGGRVRFKTDSSKIVITATLDKVCVMPHFAITGSVGMDLYEKENGAYRYLATVIPSPDTNEPLVRTITLPDDGKMRDLTLNLPLYTDVKTLAIGIEDGARMEQGDDYLPVLPIVYYGSSITQGGCASRPGRSYPSILCRRFDRDFVNLGFSGNARAEDAIIQYISALNMSMFVLDYDHNSPSPDHLALTCKQMFDAVRTAHPTLPILLMSRPKYFLTPEEENRRLAVFSIYQTALESGDENVYFLDGKALTASVKEEGTVDNCHPTDLGFASMANAVGEVMETIFQKERIGHPL